MPFIYYEGYHLRGWAANDELYAAGSSVEVPTATTFTASWAIGDRLDPYPGDDSYTDDGELVYEFKIHVIQAEGGKISPETMNVARGETLKFKVEASEGYYIKNVLVDGVSATLDDNGEYQFISVGEDHSITGHVCQIHKHGL